MKIEYLLAFAFIAILLSISKASAAHYIIGIVNNARDGTSANGMNVSLWNPARGTSDNLTDIIGINGNSHSNNVYMIDCELLSTPCKVGETISVRLLTNNPNYVTELNNASVIVTGSGYNLVQNFTLNSPPNVTGVIVDDSISSPLNEIDLTVGSTRLVNCTANVTEYDSNNIQNTTATFYNIASSSYSASDDNNTHYTNSSCYTNQSFNGSTKKQVTCSFYLQYYSNPGNWRCLFEVADNYTKYKNNTDTANVNTLLAVQVPTYIDYGSVASNEVSQETILNISNAGNTKINITLSGYSVNSGDLWAMNCSRGSPRNISIAYEKYNLTSSNPGTLTFAAFQSTYANLTSSPTTKRFSLNFRQQDSYDDAFNLTYWRIYVPSGPAGSCSGNIVIGATTNAGSN